MKETTLDRIIEIIKRLNEDAVIAAPTNNTGSTPEKPGFSNSSNSGGPTAGFDPFLGKKRKENKKFASLGLDSRRSWMQKRKPPQ